MVEVDNWGRIPQFVLHWSSDTETRRATQQPNTMQINQSNNQPHSPFLARRHASIVTMAATEVVGVSVLEQAFALRYRPATSVPCVLLPVHVRL